MSKFKKGDTVRIVRQIEIDVGVSPDVGSSGIIAIIDLDDDQGLTVRVDVDGYGPWWYREEFLELDDNQAKPAPTPESGTTPAHYSAFAIQPTEYIMANDLNWLQGNVVKYVTRYPLKNGLEDLKKARHCVDQLIKELE